MSIKNNNQYTEPLSFQSNTLANLAPISSSVGQASIKSIRPRRRLNDTSADGVETLIQKTMAIGLRPNEEGLSANEDGNEWLQALNQRDPHALLWGVTKIRKYVCGEGSDAHAAELIEFKVLERLQDFLNLTTPTDTLFEILWIITNIAAGPTAHTTVLVDKGFIIPLGHLLAHPRGNIRTQAAWAIGNIIGDREGFRDLVLEAGLLPFILDIWNGEGLDNVGKRESFRISLWIVDNMCRYKPDWQLMRPAFDIIPRCLEEDDPAILKECCWAVARILHQSGRNQEVDSMITAPFCSRLVEIFRWGYSMTTHPILRALINLASSKNPAHLKYIADAGLISELEEYLLKSRTSFEIFAIQILGNLSSRCEYADLVSQRPGLCQWILSRLGQADLSRDLKYEVGICVRNLLFHRLDTISNRLCNFGGDGSQAMMESLKMFLQTTAASDRKLIVVCLECIEYLANTRSTTAGPSLYAESMRNADLFPLLLNAHVIASGQGLEEMEHTLNGRAEFDDEDEEEDDDDGDQLVFVERNLVSFDISNPYARQTKIQASSSFSIREKVANKSLVILRFLFPKELQTAIHNSQQDSAISLALGDMGLEKKTSDQGIDFLMSSFSNLSPSKK